MNGVIGHAAYAMILSQYGTLPVAPVSGTGGTGQKGKDGKPVPAPRPASLGRQSTISALLVACISGNGETRYPPGAKRATGLLDERLCRDALNRSRGHALKSG